MERHVKFPYGPTLATACWLSVFFVCVANGQTHQPARASAASSECGMTFLFHDDPKFIEGLRRHGLLEDYGYRIHSTGYDLRPFGERWINNPLLADARRSGRPYYIDRITGGMPFQSLKGIEPVAAELKDDPRFLGFQLHEWGNSSIYDYSRLDSLLLKKGLTFSRENFLEYEGRTESPFFASGDFSIYKKVYRPLRTQKDLEKYLADYFRMMSKKTRGQLMAVNGYYQGYHLALRLGAKNVMAEIGNQVPLTAMQIACVRGAARQYGREFGVYYEPWGGAPFGCPCAMDWSSWFPAGSDPDNPVRSDRISPELGSSRSLQRRLLYYAWLSGAKWYAEEWGDENYFSNWDDYPLTEYGKVVEEFFKVTSQYGSVSPIVPAAIVLPPGTPVIDLRYVGGYEKLLYKLFEPDVFHVRMRHFARHILAAQPRRSGADDFNLTPSPWIGSFDVLSADAPDSTLSAYGLLVSFSDGKKTRKPSRADQRILFYTGRDDDARACVEALKQLDGGVEGEVGCAKALIDGERVMIGLFNNLGISKRYGEEKGDSKATRKATVRGVSPIVEIPLGKPFMVRRDQDSIEFAIPAGEVVLVLFPNNQPIK